MHKPSQAEKKSTQTTVEKDNWEPVLSESQPLSQYAKDKTISIDEYVGQKLRDFRKRAVITLFDLAEKVGVSHQQIHKYELGQTKISTGMLYKFCKIFSVTPNSFFEGFNFESTLDISDKDGDIADYRNLNRINVLLIEDSAEDQFLFRRAIEEYDLNVNMYCIHDGEEFFNIIKTKANITHIPMPDIIFLDLNMPKINGNSLLKSIKQNRELQYIPIIILTGSISRKDVMTAYKNYASGYIRKSFEYETFKENLHIALTYWTEAVILPYQALN
ncbi:MAG: response regulator [Proteobacteria bacterium]|nr:response regulator [Pseudomonadota bacterium]